MKIALFSDIHANLPALDAVLADIDSHQPDAVYCLGDLVGYNAVFVTGQPRNLLQIFRCLGQRYQAVLAVQTSR